MSFSAIGAFARRRAAPVLARHTQKRGFALGGSSGPPPDWQGVDKVVRSYFPADYQLSIAILSGYAGLYVLFKIKSLISGTPAVVEAAPASTKVETPSTGIPGIESPEFEKFVETEAFYKLLENETQLNALIESA